MIRCTWKDKESKRRGVDLSKGTKKRKGINMDEKGHVYSFEKLKVWKKSLGVRV